MSHHFIKNSQQQTEECATLRIPIENHLWFTDKTKVVYGLINNTKNPQPNLGYHNTMQNY